MNKPILTSKEIIIKSIFDLLPCTKREMRDFLNYIYDGADRRRAQAIFTGMIKDNILTEENEVLRRV